MLRHIAGAMLALALTGCWVSEKDLFGPGDWKPPPGIAGTYTSENGSGDAQAKVLLTVREDGLVEGIATKIGEDTSESSLVGFVPVPGGSGRYYLLVDQSGTAEAGGSDGNIYFVARTTNEGFEAFWPQCEGTPALPGMQSETQDLLKQDICGFTTKEALLQAGQAAERDLEAKHMFEPMPMGKMKRISESAGRSPDGYDDPAD